MTKLSQDEDWIREVVLTRYWSNLCWSWVWLDTQFWMFSGPKEITRIKAMMSVSLVYWGVKRLGKDVMHIFIFGGQAVSTLLQNNVLLFCCHWHASYVMQYRLCASSLVQQWQTVQWKIKTWLCKLTSMVAELEETTNGSCSQICQCQRSICRWIHIQWPEG